MDSGIQREMISVVSFYKFVVVRRDLSLVEVKDITIRFPIRGAMFNGVRVILPLDLDRGTCAQQFVQSIVDDLPVSYRVLRQSCDSLQ